MSHLTLHLLRANGRWVAPRSRRVANAVARAVAGSWICRLTRRHQLVRCLPFCFRCEQDWPAWDDVPGRKP